jgi:methyl-accepting chemotaxis protein
MNWLKDLKIGTKLTGGFLVLVVLMGIIAMNGYSSVKIINEKLDEILSVRLPVTNMLLSSDRDLQQLLVAERSLIFSEPEAKFQKVAKRVSDQC